MTKRFIIVKILKLNTMEIIIVLIIVPILMLIVRLFGAWMLRIDEVIKNQKEIIEIMKKQNNIN